MQIKRVFAVAGLGAVLAGCGAATQYPAANNWNGASVQNLYYEIHAAEQSHHFTLTSEQESCLVNAVEANYATPSDYKGSGYPTPTAKAAFEACGVSVRPHN